MCTVLYMLVFGLCVFKFLVVEIYPSMRCVSGDHAVVSQWGSYGWSGSLHAANRVQESSGIVLFGLQRTAVTGSANASAKNAIIEVMEGYWYVSYHVEESGIL